MKTHLKYYFLLTCCILAGVSCSNKNVPDFTNSTDVGTVGIAGSDSFDSKTNTYTLTGSGRTIWGQKDGFHLVWKKVSGDFLVEGELGFVSEGGAAHKKIGFMVRESLDDNSRYADIAIHGDGLTYLQYRKETGGATSEMAARSNAVGSTLIRLTRVGNRFSMRIGKDSLPTSDDAALLLDLPEECYVGLFVCSHDDSVTETAYFKNVHFTQQLPVEKGIAKISIFADHIESIARQEGISFAKAAELVRDLGFTGADTRVLQRKENVETLDSLGFAHSSAITDINYSQPDQAEIEEQTLAFMAERGYQTLLVVPGLVRDEFTKEQRDEIRVKIAAFTKRGTDKGYKVLVEDFDNRRSLCYNAELLDTLFTVSPTLGLVFDTGNFLFCGQDAEECLVHFRDKVGHVHLKDRVSPSDMTCTPAGTGCIPIAKIVASLDSSGYEGWFTVEQFGSRDMLSDSKTAYDNTLAALKAARE